MVMPVNFLVVRHGESYGNVAKRLSQGGDNSVVERLKGTHTAHWPLTIKGIEQAVATGKYLNSLHEKKGLVFDRMWVSSYARAMQTAHNLDLLRASWYVETRITERDWGTLDHLSEEERHEKFGQEIAMRNVEPFFWAPPTGETFNSLVIRVRDFLDSVHRADSQNTIVVCHGEVAKAFRIVLCRLTPADYAAMEFSTDQLKRFHNCQIDHYTRRNPNTEELSPYLDWLRVCRPANGVDVAVDWERIVRKKYSNDDLRTMATALSCQFDDIKI